MILLCPPLGGDSVHPAEPSDLTKPLHLVQNAAAGVVLNHMYLPVEAHSQF